MDEGMYPSDEEDIGAGSDDAVSDARSNVSGGDVLRDAVLEELSQETINVNEHTQELMRACAIEYARSHFLATALWNTVSDTISGSPGGSRKRSVLFALFANCELDNAVKRRKVVLRDEPLNWIDVWKRDRGVVITTTDPRFQVLPGKGKFLELAGDRAVPLSRGSLRRFDLPGTPSPEPLGAVGVIKPNIKDTAQIVRELKTKTYTLRQVQKRLNEIMGLELSPVVLRQLRNGDEIFISDVLSQETIPGKYNARFVPPKKDKDIGDIGTTVEYWIPETLSYSKEKVFRRVEEVFRTRLSGTKVYLKLDSIDVKLGRNQTFTLYFFRKFFDFLDYLKAWQLTFVDKVLTGNVGRDFRVASSGYSLPQRPTTSKKGKRSPRTIKIKEPSKNVKGTKGSIEKAEQNVAPGLRTMWRRAVAAAPGRTRPSKKRKRLALEQAPKVFNVFPDRKRARVPPPPRERVLYFMQKVVDIYQYFLREAGRGDAMSASKAAAYARDVYVYSETCPVCSEPFLDDDPGNTQLVHLDSGPYAGMFVHELCMEKGF